MAERSQAGQLAAEQAGEGSDMMAGNDEAGGLARGVVGSARTIAFGTSIVAPSASAATVLVPWALFIVILTAAVLVAYLGITTSASVDLVLVAGEIAVIAALAITILVKIGPARYTAAVFSPASSPNQRLADLTDAMIYGFTAFAGFEAAAALGEEAKNSRRSVPVSIVGIVVVTGIFYLLVVCAEAFAAGRHGIAGLIGQASPLGYLTSRFWSPSALWSIDLVIVLAGLSFVVSAINAAIRVMFTMGRERALPGSLGRLSHRRTPVAAIGCLAVITLRWYSCSPSGASCSLVPTRWRTCCPSFLSAGS